MKNSVMTISQTNQKQYICKSIKPLSITILFLSIWACLLLRRSFSASTSLKPTLLTLGLWLSYKRQTQLPYYPYSKELQSNRVCRQHRPFASNILSEFQSQSQWNFVKNLRIKLRNNFKISFKLCENINGKLWNIL